MSTWSRRDFLNSSAGVIAAMASMGPSAFAIESGTRRKGHIRQSVAQWCFPKLTIDALSAVAAKIGLQGVDLLEVQDYDIPRRYGLRCTMAYLGHGYEDPMEIESGYNRLENHDRLEELCRENIPKAANSGITNAIVFSGNRDELPDDTGIKNAIVGLNRVKNIAEDHGVTLCLELLSHKNYMFDHTAWGVRVMEGVNSPNVKILYDIFHAQIMDGNLINTITKNIQWIGHFHTGGVPGRGNLDNTQEINWVGVMQAIVRSGYKGYVAHEFLPKGDPIAALRAAVDLCDV